MRVSRVAEKESSQFVLSDIEAARFAAGHGDDRGHTQLGGLIPLVQDGRVRKILRAIESHPSRKIHELAIECNLSPSHLQHLFKQSTGVGLGQLLTELRMRQAIGFLAHSSMSIKEIAFTVGYEHTSSFTRAFERHFRQAPRAYRQAQDAEKRANGDLLKVG